MSDFTSKDHKGLLEAYHSIYKKKEEVVEELNESVEETLTEDYDVNILLENVKDYLVLRGYVDTEDQAYNIMPHMTEEFFGKLIGEMHVIGTCISMKEHLISEGCEVEDYTIEDMLNLFEYYEKENLNEVAITAAAATSPWWLPAAAAAVGAAGMYLQSRKKQPAKPVDYGQVKADIDAREKEKAKNKPLSKKQQREAERRAAREQGSQTPAPSKARTQNQPSSSETAGKPPASSSSSAPAPAPTPQPPQPPKPPKGPGVFAKIGDKFNKAMQNLQKSNQAPPTSTPGYIKNLPASAKAILKNTQTLATGAKNLMVGKKGAPFIDRLGRTSATSGALGAEFAASKRDPAGPSIAGQSTANVIGGVGNVVKQTGRAVNQVFPGMTGTERTGQDIKDFGQRVSDADKGKLNKNKPLDPSKYQNKYYTGDL